MIPPPPRYVGIECTLLMLDRMPIFTAELADYIFKRISTDGNEALRCSPTAKKEDGTEKSLEEYLAILKTPIQGSAWVKTEKVRTYYIECVKKIRGRARLASERTLVNSLTKRLV